MTAPRVALGRFAAACLMGMALGLVYGFLRPVRRKAPGLGDFLFLLTAGGAWIYVSFGVCMGDLRLGYTAGLFLGGFFWEWTVGRLLRPVFFGLWRFLSSVFRFLLFPWKKFLEFFY